MASFGKRKPRPKPVMNVTPLVDVVLVLLIIFMVVIPMMEKAAQVELPSIDNVDPSRSEQEDPFTLSLTRDGQTYFENDLLAEGDLERALRDAHRREPVRKIVVRADQEARYVNARNLFRIAQTVGFPGVSMRVNQRGGENDPNSEQHASR